LPPRSRNLMTTPSPHIDPALSDQDRAALARAQAELVNALHKSAPPPEGFNPEQIETASDSLARKRSRSVQKSWPATAAALGDAFDSRFNSYCAEHPAPPESPLEDGFQFAQWLARQKLLPPDGRLELTRHRVRRDGFPRILFSKRTVTLFIRTGKSLRVIRLKF